MLFLCVKGFLILVIGVDRAVIEVKGNQGNQDQPGPSRRQRGQPRQQQRDAQNQNNQVPDERNEIKQYQLGRYISANSAIWR